MTKTRASTQKDGKIGMQKPGTSVLATLSGHRQTNRGVYKMKRIEFADIGQLWRDYLELNSVHEVADRHGCSHSAVHRALKNAGYRLNREKWTAEEEATLTAYYTQTAPEVFHPEELAAQMGRSLHAVHVRAHRMGLTTRKGQRPKADRQKIINAATLKKVQQEQGHARGMKGKKHSTETLDRLSEISTERWAKMTPEQQEERQVKIQKTRAERGIRPPERPGASWKAGWREIAGRRIYFRSQWEVNYAHYLQWLKDLGQIKEWEFEAETFWFTGIKRGVMSYLPDFRVTENSGNIVFYEIKGWMDDRSKTKLKRMAKYHPQIKLVLIDSKAYRTLSRQVRNAVPGWE